MPTTDLSVTHFLEKLYRFKNCSIHSSMQYVNKQVSSVFGMRELICHLCLVSRKQKMSAIHLMEVLKDTSSFTCVLVRVFQLYLASCKTGWVFPRIHCVNQILFKIVCHLRPEKDSQQLRLLVAFINAWSNEDIEHQTLIYIF